MPAIHLTTLRMRVTAWYVGLLASALLVFGAALYFGVQGYLRNSLEQSLRLEAKAVASTFLSQEETKGQPWMQGEIEEAYEPEVSARFLRVTRQDQKVLYQSGDTRDPYINSSAVSPAVFRGSEESFRQEALGGKHRLLVYTQPYVSVSGIRYVVETGASLGPISHALMSLLKILVLITPCILLVAALGGHFLMTLPLRPLVVLTEQAERIGAHQLGERLPVIATGDEMERLSLSLNRMISRLEDALAYNRRFSADVSHELRTPLTILRGELEQLLHTTKTTLTQQDSLGSALEEIDRMAKIVESLLTISRLDSGTDCMDLKPVDLSSLARWTVDQMHLLVEEKNIALRILRSEPVVILADAGRIKQVLVNLLDNAIKYTPNGGKITISVSKPPTAGLAILEISDTGIGIPAASLPHVFERFYRSDKARTRESGGAGLGLSIVKAISKAHGGTVTIESAEGGGTRVRLALPLSSLPAVVEPESKPQASHAGRPHETVA
jgi:two-component system, OmpR family, sensor kinase